MRSFSKVFIALSIVFLVSAGTASAGLVSEYGEIRTDFVADFTTMTKLLDKETTPTYYLWANDTMLTSWTLAWTGGSNPMPDFSVPKFYGAIELENSTGDFTEYKFESNDSLGSTAGLIADFDAFATGGVDGINITINSWTNPSYIGFDLFLDIVDNNDPTKSIVGQVDGAKIFVGADLKSVASLGEDGDFAVNAPVPEPATMILLGIGLLGVAGVTRRKMK